MKKNVYLSLSTDPINDFHNLIEYAKQMQEKTDLLHCDVMDRQFVERKTYDYTFVNALNKSTPLMLDVHLMVKEPSQDIEKYIEAGANILTVHYEAFENKTELLRIIKLIQKEKCLAGLAIKPDTTFKDIKTFLYNVDVVLVMSVEPGLSGQKFMPEVLSKVKQLDKFRRDNKLNYKIEIDGGINAENAKFATDAGVDILVSGSYVYKAQNKQEAINNLKNCG